MKIRRLHVTDFAAIREADVELGPGLNVLYGPNDLGKSTLADAVRLVLLLPHTSTHIEDYIPWTGGQNPMIQLTFETEPHRIWRVRKEFRKGGAATLEESKNGVDFDPIERARRVDAKLREILQWGIPEPGGAGGSKGLPSSFLATALLSTQADVTAVLSQSLSSDPSGSGKARIAAALEAVAQDPLFAALLRETQARRDRAYTDKGAKKTAKGSVFKEAADRVNAARDEMERLRKLVQDSEGVEKQLQELIAKRATREEAAASAIERVNAVHRLAAEAAALRDAAELVRSAGQEVERIKTIDCDIAAAERNLTHLAEKLDAAGNSVKAAQASVNEADAAFEAARNAAAADGSDSSTKYTFARQTLEVRRLSAEQAGREAQRRLEAAVAAQKMVDGAATATREHEKRQREADAAGKALRDAGAREEDAGEQLRRLDLLERAVENRAAEEQAAAARTSVEKEASLRAGLESNERERSDLAARRTAIIVPSTASLGPMRRLESDLAAARGALNVGIVVTVTPTRPLDLQIEKDGAAPQVTTTADALEIDANTAIDVGIGDVARVRVRGGRRQAQEMVRQLEKRWSDEVAPHLFGAGVKDLDGLGGKAEEAHALETAITLKQAESQTLRDQLVPVAGSSERLEAALKRAEASRAALRRVSLDSLAPELATLGQDPATTLRAHRQKFAEAAATARATVAKASTEYTLAEERRRASQVVLDTAIADRDVELAKFPDGLTAESSAAQTSAATAADEQQTVATELAALERTIADQTARIEAAVSGARDAVTRARAGLEAAEQCQTEILKAHAAEGGQRELLRKQRELQDLEAAEAKLNEATERQDALPVPETLVTENDVVAARNAEASAKGDLERVLSDIHKAQGALEQVGGAVARERLRDAIEAFERADRDEREFEDEYEAWLLLLEQMRQAEAAQASNLGQVLAPAIAGKFEALTQKRYEDLRLTAQLGTEGVVVSGAVRPPERISVGTREQLSTLYRLSLAEYLGTTVVLDDQLVQSDDTRMDWFRALLAEKAGAFQIIVFTCRPNDYLETSGIVPNGKGVHKDTAGGLIRAIDLASAVQRR